MELRRQVLTTIPALFVEMGVSLTFYLDWPQVIILHISASQVAGIIGVELYAKLWIDFFFLMVPIFFF
jgi:hypothetical protein